MDNIYLNDFIPTMDGSMYNDDLEYYYYKKYRKYKSKLLFLRSRIVKDDLMLNNDNRID